MVEQEKLDNMMIEMDGTENKGKLLFYMIKYHITHPHVVPNLYDVLYYVEHKRRCSAACLVLKMCIK